MTLRRDAPRHSSAPARAIVDAVFLDAEERVQIERAADDAGVSFQGLWLTAPEDVLARRVGARRGDFGRHPRRAETAARNGSEHVDVARAGRQRTAGDSCGTGLRSLRVATTMS